MIALIGLMLGMAIGVAVRELWSRRNKAKGHARTALMALGLLIVWVPILWLMVSIFLKRPPG